MFQHSEREFVLKFSALEIYNESVRDLLSVDSTPLRLLDDPEVKPFPEQLLVREFIQLPHGTLFLSSREEPWLRSSQRKL